MFNEVCNNESVADIDKWVIIIVLLLQEGKIWKNFVFKIKLVIEGYTRQRNKWKQYSNKNQEQGYFYILYGHVFMC